MTESTKVKLGDRDYAIVPQGIGRIRRKLTKIVRLVDGELDVTELTDELYDVLKLFIPDLAPMWQLLGYAGPEAYQGKRESDAEIREAEEANVLERAKADTEGREPELAPVPEPFEEPDVDEDQVVTPTIPQIEDALDAVYKVNGGQRLVKLLEKVIGLDIVRAKLRAELANWNLSGSASSPSPSGDSPSISSTTSPPTSKAENGDSPSPAPSVSSTPETAGTASS